MSRLIPDHLDELARSLLEIAPSGHSLVRVRRRCDGEPELAVGELAKLQPELRHPLDALVGFRAPANWAVLGLLGGGTGHLPDDGARGRSVRFALLVGRDGSQHCELDGLEPDRRGGGEPDGLLTDALRRCLGLPTPRPRHPPSRWATAAWLDALTAQRPPARSWPRLLAAHPLCGPGARSAAALLRRTQLLDELGWPALRRAAAGSAGPTPTSAEPSELAELAELAGARIEPLLARWSDDGSLARFCEASHPPLSFLLDAAEAVLATEAAREVAHLARAMVAARTPAPGLRDA